MTQVYLNAFVALVQFAPAVMYAMNDKWLLAGAWTVITLMWALATYMSYKTWQARRYR